jgi:hypothetical protein
LKELPKPQVSLKYEHFPVGNTITLMSRLNIAFASAYFIAGFVAFSWAIFVEPDLFLDHSTRTIVVSGLMILFGFFTCWQAIISLRFKSVRTDEDRIYLEFKKFTTEIPYDTITEIEIVPSGEILIYAKDSPGWNPYAISGSISHSEILEMHLARKVKVSRRDSADLFHHPLQRFITTSIAFAALGVHFVSENKTAILAGGLTYVAFAMFNIAGIFKYKDKGKGIDTMTIATTAVFTIWILVNIIRTV